MHTFDHLRVVPLLQAITNNTRLIQEAQEQVVRSIELARENVRLREKVEQLKRDILLFTLEIDPM